MANIIVGKENPGTIDLYDEDNGTGRPVCPKTTPRTIGRPILAKSMSPLATAASGSGSALSRRSNPSQHLFSKRSAGVVVQAFRFRTVFMTLVFANSQEQSAGLSYPAPEPAKGL